MIELFQSIKKLFRKSSLTLIQELKDSENNSPFHLLDQVKKLIDSGEFSSYEEQRYYLALKYRLEQEPCPYGSVAALMDLALSWKRAHPIYGRAVLDPRELNQLKEASRYPEFIPLLADSTVQDNFFEWVLRDGNESVPFIEFPEACNRIKASQLSGRINQNGISYLRILKEGGKKILALPFEGTYRNILDLQAKITFRGNYTLTIQEIFEIFAKKEFQVGNLEFFQEGIVNWNIHKLGYWDAELKTHLPIDITKNTWWEAMPLLEVINRKQVFKRYGHFLKANEWILSPVATRGNPNLDFNATHAFLEVVIPYQGNFAVYNFGKLATVYPTTTFDRVKMLTKTVHGTIAYPDDTSYYRHRQRGFHPFVLNEAQGQHLMELICQDIKASRSLTVDYQIQSENCAKWVFNKLEGVLGRGNVPDFFRMQLLDTEPGGVVACIFSCIKKLPSKWQVPVLMFFHIPLGANRTLWIQENGEWVPKSLRRHSFFKTGQVYLPALLVHKVMQLKSTYSSIFFKRSIKSNIISFFNNLLFPWRNIRYLKFFLRCRGSFFTPIL